MYHAARGPCIHVDLAMATVLVALMIVVLTAEISRLQASVCGRHSCEVFSAHVAVQNIH